MLVRITLAFIACIVCVQGADYPEARISNRQIKAKVYLPDPKTGFYRGLRFDWS